MAIETEVTACLSLEVATEAPERGLGFELTKTQLKPQQKEPIWTANVC